jgi:hypothetical protein
MLGNLKRSARSIPLCVEGVYTAGTTFLLPASGINHVTRAMIVTLNM